MWSVALATLYPLQPRPAPSPHNILLLLIAATPACLVITGVVLDKLSFRRATSGSAKLSFALALVMCVPRLPSPDLSQPDSRFL